LPAALLPEVKDCAGLFGETVPELLGAAIPVRGIAGDQQAATIGQACFSPGMVKSTYGTGCFALAQHGFAAPVASKHRLLSTIAYQFGGQRTYALEGSIFIAGAAVQWLRDGLGIIETASETGPLAEAADPAQEVYLVPAFVGLGAPHWDAQARGAMFGLTRNTGPREFARAALESVCYQTLDLIEAMHADWPAPGRAGDPCCASMAAWSPPTGRCSASPTSWTSGRPARRAGDDGAGRGLSGRARCRALPEPDRSPISGGWSGASRRPWPPASARRKVAGWRDSVRRTLIHRDYMTLRILGLPSRRALIRPRLTNEKRLAPLGDRLTVGPQTLTLVV
jgi:glycerol kinase